MSDLPSITWTHKFDYGFEKVKVETAGDTGYLTADLDPKSGEFRVETFGVSTPRIGLGKEILRQAELAARELNARRIVATIVSAECLASMTEVFGADNISIERQGDFGEAGRTLAQLVYHIEEPYL